MVARRVAGHHELRLPVQRPIVPLGEPSRAIAAHSSRPAAAAAEAAAEAQSATPGNKTAPTETNCVCRPSGRPDRK